MPITELVFYAFHIMGLQIISCYRNAVILGVELHKRLKPYIFVADMYPSHSLCFIMTYLILIQSLDLRE